MWKYLRLSEGDIFLDVGAHIGKYTIPMAKIVGEDGLVIAIEPDLENYKTLVENIKLNSLKNVIALNIAAWSEETELKFFIGDTHDLGSVKRDYGKGHIIVKGRDLDTVLNELGVKRVNYIKIDVEGAGLEVLKGLEKTLRKYLPIVIIEIWGDPTEVKKFISGIGYEMRKIDPDNYILEPSSKLRALS
jgi:FkbM family methyltransferase